MTQTISAKAQRAIDAATALTQRDGFFTCESLGGAIGVSSKSHLKYYTDLFAKICPERLSRIARHWRLAPPAVEAPAIRKIATVRMSDKAEVEFEKMIRGYVHDISAPWESFATVQDAADRVVADALAALRGNVNLTEFRRGQE